jgi:cytidylate kinase
MDRSRKFSPLQKHPDAVVVNTTKLDKKAMVAKMSKYVERFLKKKYGNRSRIK